MLEDPTTPDPLDTPPLRKDGHSYLGNPDPPQPIEPEPQEEGDPKPPPGPPQPPVPADFTLYRRTGTTELRPYVEDEDLTGVSISPEDAAAGSPRVGDMIARNPANHDDKWLVSEQYFANNYEPA